MAVTSAINATRKDITSLGKRPVIINLEHEAKKQKTETDKGVHHTLLSDLVHTQTQLYVEFEKVQSTLEQMQKEMFKNIHNPQEFVRIAGKVKTETANVKPMVEQFIANEMESLRAHLLDKFPFMEFFKVQTTITNNEENEATSAAGSC